VIQIACPLLAGCACLSAARRSENFAKPLWLLFGASVFWWALAQTVATYYDSVLHASVQEPWPGDIIYFLGMSVPLTILFIDQKNGFERKQWPRLFDLAQVFIIMLAFISSRLIRRMRGEAVGNPRADCVDSGNFARRTAAPVV